MIHLINLIGAPGVGKTYIAQRISRLEGIFFFDRDIIYDALFWDDSISEDSQDYKKMSCRLIEASWGLAIDNAKRGVSSILENPMTFVIQGKQDIIVDNALEDAKNHHFGLHLVYCVSTAEQIYKNLKHRGCARDRKKFKDYDAFVHKFIDVPGPIYEHIRIDTRDSLECNISKVLDYMGRR